MVAPHLTEPRVCASCGRTATATNLFCGNCGSALTAVSAESAQPPITPPTSAPPRARTQPPPRPHAQAVAPPVPAWGQPPAVPVPARERSQPPALLATIAVLIVLTFAGAATAIILAITGSDNAQPGSTATTTTVTVLTSAR